MKITDRFIKVPAETYAEKSLEMGIDTNPEIRDVYLCPMQIESFSAQDESTVCVSLKSEGCVYVVMGLDEFIKTIEDFYNK